jgi:hypothetical protein
MPIVLLILGLGGIAYMFTRGSANQTTATKTATDANNSVGNTVWHKLTQSMFPRWDGKGKDWTCTVPDIVYADRFKVGDKWQRDSDGRWMEYKPDGNVYAKQIDSNTLLGGVHESFSDLVAPYDDNDWDFGKVLGDTNADGTPSANWKKTPKAVAISAMTTALPLAQAAFDAEAQKHFNDNGDKSDEQIKAEKIAADAKLKAYQDEQIKLAEKSKVSPNVGLLKVNGVPVYIDYSKIGTPDKNDGGMIGLI